MIVAIMHGDEIGFVMRGTKKEINNALFMPIYMYKVSAGGNLIIPTYKETLYPFPMKFMPYSKEVVLKGAKAKEFAEKIDEVEAIIAEYPPEKNLLNSYKELGTS